MDLNNNTRKNTMLANVMAVIFGQRNSQELVYHQLLSRWQDWLIPITKDNPVGEDLSYHDDFQLIREELAKISAVDAELIVQLSEKLLRENSKDIRVATYFTWAKLRLSGAAGLADGLELVAGLIERFAEDLYPTRANIRKSALEWLASTKFIDLLYSLSPLAKDDLERTLAALVFIIKQTDLWAESNRPDLQPLVRFYNNQLAQPVPFRLAAQEQAEPAMNKLAVKPDNTASLRDLFDQARAMTIFLREQPNGYLAAFRLIRAVRWDTIVLLPSHDAKGYTQILAPRMELRQHLNRLYLQQQWPELLDQVERAYAEGANHFWLDLQRYACSALLHSNESYRRCYDICLTDVSLMLDRLKGIEHLFYMEGIPFADDETKQWINNTASMLRLDEGEVLAPIPLDAGGVTDWHEMELQAAEMASREGLQVAFGWLQSLPNMTSTRQQFLQRFLFARIAHQSGQLEVAIRLLIPLNREIEQYQLNDWEPDLVFEIKAYLLKLFQKRLLLKDADKIMLTQQVDRLLNALTVLNPARTLAL